MADKLIYVPNDDTKNKKCLKRLDTQLNEPTNHNSIKITNFFKPTNT